MIEFSIYTTRNCSFCKMSKRLLDKRGIKFAEIRIDEGDGENLREMLKRTNNLKTVPQIFAGDVHIGGYENLGEWARDGRLDELLQTT